MSGAWMVRAEGGQVIEGFLQKSVVAMGWSDVPDLSSTSDKDALRRVIETTYPDERPGRKRSWLGQFASFRFGMKPGDLVVSYVPETRLYHTGQIKSEYAYDPKAIPNYPHVRRVEWSGKVKRDDLSVSARNTLGAIMTVFSLGQDVAKELTSLAKGGTRITKPDSEDDDIEQLRKDAIGRSHEFIKDRVRRLSWEEMQDLVAGLLRGLGYQTRVSPPGADRGKDIMASRDGLGLEEPRIRVEVKHRPNEPMGAPDVRSFIGAMRGGDRGVYVSTGGFTREAHYEAERAQTPLTLLDLDDLVALLTRNYETLDADAKALVPLIRVYWPAT